jgi:hypothetical protein
MSRVPFEVPSESICFARQELGEESGKPAAATTIRILR